MCKLGGHPFARVTLNTLWTMSVRWRQSHNANRLRIQKRRLRSLEKARKRNPLSFIAGAKGNAPTELRPEVDNACPEILDFVKCPQDTAKFFSLLRKRAHKCGAGEMVVNLRNVNEVTPAAALVLIAELCRINFFHRKLKVKVALPAAPEPHALLSNVGFYEYCDGVSTEKSVSGSRIFWKHRRGVDVRQDAVAELINFLPKLSKSATQRLFEALVEGMQNTSEHAYNRSKRSYRFWWLLGYQDTKTKEMAFCFFDQGAGIPQTIRTRFKDKLFLFRPTGSELIHTAVMEGRYSRTKEKSRGRGLPALKRFIDDAIEGELLIFSRESQCVFRDHGQIKSGDYDTKLHGTLISWTLRANGQ